MLRRAAMITLYDNLPSGNAYKVRLLLSLLGIPFRRVEKDILKGETRTPEFLAKNPNGRIPLVEFEDGRRLAESNAILYYFAQGTRFFPPERFAQAEVLQWMFFEQYSHEPYIAVARFWIHSLGKREEWADRLREKHERGYQALGVMEQHLGGRRFLSGEAPSVADLALYAYTHVADEGDFDLASYPRIRAWLAQVASLPGYVPITRRDFG
jgi:glutathione S-transferase